MDAKDFRSLQEAYLEMYSPEKLDEVLDTPQKTQSYAAKNAASAVGAFVRGDAKTLSKRFEGAKRGMKKIEKRKDQREEVGIDEEKWIQKAIKKPGSLHKQLGVPAGEKIPAKELAAASKKGGKLGKRARLAQTLKSLNKEDFKVILHHLIDEGYTNTLNGAEVIASNMSYDWIVSILDEGEKPLPYGRMIKKSNELADSGDKKNQKRAAKIYTAANAPKGPKVKVR